ncbi:MAG: DUF1761 family protein [Bacteroidetes bacterium]|nr:DUF1761 family protein [Bacteroidota bacterium]
MNKSIIYSTITGTIVYFLLGWLFYGILFTDLYPSNQEYSMQLVLLGSLFYVLVFSLIYARWASISTFKSGAKVGLVLGIVYAISMNSYYAASNGLNIEHFLTDVLIATVSTAIMGGVVALTIGKTK